MYSELQIRWSESKHDDLKIWIWSEQICTMQTRWPEDAEGGNYDGLIWPADGRIDLLWSPRLPDTKGASREPISKPQLPRRAKSCFSSWEGLLHTYSSTSNHALCRRPPLPWRGASLFRWYKLGNEIAPTAKKSGRGLSPPPHSSSNGKNGAHLRFKSLRHMVISCEGIGLPLKSFDPESMKKTMVFLFSISLLDVIDHLFLIPLPMWDYWRPADHLVLFFVWRSMFSAPPSPLFFQGPNTFHTE